MRKKAPRKLDHEDEALWHHVARKVKPLPRKNAPRVKLVEAKTKTEAPAPTKAKPKAKPATPAKPRAAAPVRPAELDAGARVGLDRRQATRLRRGQLELDGRIDLHGKTREEARGALFAFLDRMRARGARCVLVITGKGLRGPGSGVIRGELPRWFNHPDLRPGIVAFTEAQPKHGGSGAFYVYLRRTRAP